MSSLVASYKAFVVLLTAFALRRRVRKGCRQRHDTASPYAPYRVEGLYLTISNSTMRQCGGDREITVISTTLL